MYGLILFGGDKSNTELQFMLTTAKKLDIDLKVVNPRDIAIIAASENNYILLNGEPIAIPDFAIAAFAKDPVYSNISCLQQLESIGVLCINRASVMQKTKDKMLTLQLLAEKQIPVPKTILYTKNLTTELISKELGFPLVLKVIGGSKGDGVVLVNSGSELENILQISNAGDLQEELILQEFISYSKGKDLRVMILGGKAKVCMQRTSGSKNNFKSNLSGDGSAVMYQLNDKVEEISNKTAETLGLFLGGIDLLFTKDGYIVNEVNSIPGFYVPNKTDNVWSIDIPTELLNNIKHGKK